MIDNPTNIIDIGRYILLTCLNMLLNQAKLYASFAIRANAIISFLHSFLITISHRLLSL